jgi:hypothetical protein
MRRELKKVRRESRRMCVATASDGLPTRIRLDNVHALLERIDDLIRSHDP